MIPVVLIVIAIIAYLLGSLNGAIITSRYVFHKDVRHYGSGNAGLTNFYRTFGFGGIAMVLGIDILKAVIACLIGGWLMGFLGYAMIGKIFAGFCTILGHSYPVFYGFKGGKGALAGFGLLLVVDWRIAFICIAVFIGVIAFTRYVSLGSLLGGACAPLSVWAFGYGGLEGTLMLFCVLLVVFAHRSNIGRLITHTESKLRVGKTPEQKLKEQDF